MDEQPMPGIQRMNLGNVIPLLKNLGIDGLVHFDYLDPPATEAVAAAITQLWDLSALNFDGKLTTLGRKVAEFPCDPPMSKIHSSSCLIEDPPRWVTYRDETLPKLSGTRTRNPKTDVPSVGKHEIRVHEGRQRD